MRKNGVNRELIPVLGGVCAPAGFRANGTYCGIAATDEIASRETNSDVREDISLIVASRRCACACTYAQGSILGAPAKLTKKRLAAGYARAVFVNSGIANVYMDGGEKLARDICGLFSKKLMIREEEIAIASTGRIGVLPYGPIAEKADELIAGLGDTHEHSLAAARGLMTTDKTVKQLSYAFELGDYTCRIGAIFKGNARVKPNMATTLCILTTDVDIAPAFLQKAFSAAINATLNLLDIDGVSSPNDFACILASGLAGNYPITADDSDYAKFYNALRETLFRVCKAIASDGERTPTVCKIQGARSAKLARAAAKAVSGSAAVRAALQKQRVDIESILCALHDAGEPFDFACVEISLGGLVLLERGRIQAMSQAALAEAFSGEEITLCVRVGNGNYAATATFCI